MRQLLAAPSQKLISSAFLMDLAGACAMLAVQFVGVALGASPTVLGILGCLGGGTYAIACLGSGAIVDRFGPRRATRLSIALTILVWLGMAMAGRIGLLLGLVVASGVVGALFWPSLMVWLADLSSEQAQGLGRALGVFNISWSVGLLGGFVVAGALWDWVGRGSFYFSVAAGVVILVLLQLTPGRATRPANPTVEEPVTLPRPALGRRLRIAGRVGVFASFFSTTIVRALFPKVGETLGYSSALVGWAMPLGAVGMVLATYAHTPWQFLLGFCLIGVCAGISYLASQFYGLHQSENRRGASMRHHEAVVGAGAVAGPLLGGMVADYTGQLSAAFALGASVMVIAGLVQIVLWWVMSRADEASVA